MEDLTLPQIPDKWCFVYSSWKEKDIYSDQGWFSILEGPDGLMGNKCKIHPFALQLRIWISHFGNRKCEKSKTISCNVHGLFSICEDGFRTKRMVYFCNMPKRYSATKSEFHSLRADSCVTNAQHKDGVVLHAVLKIVIFCYPHGHRVICLVCRILIEYIILLEKKRPLSLFNYVTSHIF